MTNLSKSTESFHRLVEELEQRLHRLENAVAAMQDPHDLENRITERVRQKLLGEQASVEDGVKEKVIDRRRYPNPPAADQAARQYPPAADPPPRGSSPLAVVTPQLTKPRWLLLDILGELASIIRMFFDVRYHVGWFARMTVLVMIPVILTSQWWLFPSLFGLGTVLDKIFALVATFFIIKILSREAKRYQQWQEDGKG